MSNGAKKVNWFRYITALVQYSGAFLTRCGNLSNVIRDSFSDIQFPKKNDFVINDKSIQK